MENPLLNTLNLEFIPYSKIKNSDYLPAFEYVISKANESISELINKSNEEKFDLKKFETSTDLFDQIKVIYNNKRRVNSLDEEGLQTEKINDLISKFESSIYMNKELYSKFKSLDINSLNLQEKAVYNYHMRKFLENGYIGETVAQSTLDRIKEINSSLSNLISSYETNLIKATDAFHINITNEEDMKEFPEKVKISARKLSQEKGYDTGYCFSLQAPSYSALMMYCSNREIRKKMYYEVNHRCNGGQFSNIEIMKKILELRKEKAKLLGFKSYNEFVLSNRMAKEEKNVYNLLDMIREKALIKAKKDYKNYYANCDSHDRTSEKIQCVSSGFQLNCKEVKIDDDCHVDNNNDCVPKDISKIDTNTQGCYDNEEKTECKIRNKECKEYSTQPTCNANNKCSYISYIYENYNFCYETETENDQVCKIVNNECTKASDSSINSDKEKCLFVYDQDKEKAICKKVEKLCYEISKNDVCNSVSTNSYKCHYLSGKCLNITLDGNCTMNNQDKCVENGSGKLSATDMCELTTSSIYYSGQCKKREKTCSDITVLNECNSYQPVNRKCFYISSSDSSTCKEIKVDSQCSINDNNECTGNGCSFENDKKDHCAYKNNGSSILKIRMLILALFFML